MGGDPTEREAALASPVRRRVVELLRDLPTQAEHGHGQGSSRGLTAHDLARRLDLHVTTVRFHLDQLIAAEVLEAEFLRGRVGRPRKIYHLSPGPLRGAKVEQAHAALTELLLESWQEESAAGIPSRAQEAGERWVRNHVTGSATPPARTPGAWLGKVGQALDLLMPWGYTREVRTLDEGRTVELSLVDCPFLVLAHAHPEVVCGVHRGLLGEAMRASGEGDVEVGLQPFVAPGRCRATLTRTVDFASGDSAGPDAEPGRGASQ